METLSTLQPQSKFSWHRIVLFSAFFVLTGIYSFNIKAQTEITPGGPAINKTVTTVGQEDWFHCVVNNDWLFATLEYTIVSTGLVQYTYLYEDDMTTLLAKNENSDPYSGGQINHHYPSPCWQVILAECPTEYYIKVKSFTTGTYNIAMNVQAGMWVKPLLIDEPYQRTYQLVYGVNEDGNAYTYDDQNVDHYLFSPSVSGEYTIETHGSLDTYMQLHDGTPYNPLLDEDDNSGEGSNALCSASLVAGKPYYIVMSATSSGEYSIEVNSGTTKYLNVSPTSISLSSGSGSSGTFNITSNTSWSITDDASWLSVSPVSGTNNGTITVTASSANTGTSSRSATVTIAGTGVANKTVTVTQLPTTYLNVSPTSISLGSGSGSCGTFTITSNTTWTITDDASWLDVSPVSGTNNGTITVCSNTANTGTSSRSATVTICGTGVTCKTVIVTQPISGKTLGNTTVYSSSSTTANRRALPITFSETGNIQSVSIYHNGGTGNVLLGVYSNVSAAPATRLGVTASTVINSAAGWQTIALTSPVAVTSGQTVWLSWVFQTNPGIRYVVGTPARAESPALWSAGMPAAFGTATYGNYKYSIYCTYTTGVPLFLTVSPTSISLGYASGSSGTFSISSNTSWSITDDGSWLTVSPTSGSNNATITVTATSANTGTSPRSATVTIAGTGVASRTVIVTQQTSGKTLGNTTVYSSSSTTANRRALPITFSEAGNIQSVSIYHNGGTGNVLLGVYSNVSAAPATRLGVTASTVINSSAGWQTVALTSPVAVTSGQTVWLSWVFQTNPGIRYVVGTPARAESPALWSGGMPAAFGTATYGNYKYSIYCTYTTVAPLYLTVSPTIISLGYASGSSGTFSISSNTSWSITDNGSWLTVSPTSGSNNATITVTTSSANTGTSSRTATVTVVGTGVTPNKSVTVSQAYPTKPPQYFNYNTNGLNNSYPFNIADGKDVQLLYLPGDFNQPTPATAGNITSISFRIADSYPLGPWTYTNLTIKMGQSTITTFTAGAFYSQLTTVYYRASVSLTGVPGQWMTIPLDNPFPYDPAKSLIVDIGHCGAPGAIGFSSCYTNVTGNRRIWSVGGCPFVYYSTNSSVYHTGLTLSPPDTKTLGNTTVYSSSSTTANRRALPVTFSEAGHIQSISIYHNGGTGSLLLGVYSNTTGAPVTRLGVTPSTVINPTAGWQTIALTSPVSVSSGQTVWLSWVFQTNPGIRYVVGTPARAESPSLWSGGMPTAFGTATFGNYKYSIYCTYTTGAGVAKSSGDGLAVNPDISDKEIMALEPNPTDISKEKVLIYPNPANGSVTVRWNNYYDRRLLLTIYDLQGTQVRTVQIEPGVNEIQVDLGDIKYGMYLFELKNTKNGLIINRSRIVKF